MKFEKVSHDQFVKDCINLFGYGRMDLIEESYKSIELPKRKTMFSAGYDFIYPFNDTTLKAGESIIFPTGIKAQLDHNTFLMLVPRSGLGFKFRLQLDNTIGIIDADYYNNDNNEGHIMAKMTNDGKEGKSVTLKRGQGFMQGIILPYLIADEEAVDTVRSGGFGSTDKV